jgi:activator of 2-hydroxyglutaryl-CoA dehydratase
MITAGIDMGTQSVKVVILKDNEIMSRSQIFSGFEPTKAAKSRCLRYFVGEILF